MAQNNLSPACVQCYMTTLLRLSRKLLEIVINLQDDKVVCFMDIHKLRVCVLALWEPTREYVIR